MIKDAIEELKEWEEGDVEDDDDDDDDDNDGQDEESDAASDDQDDKDSIENMFSAANALPKDRPDLKKQLATADDKLKKVAMLYAALIKRRLKTFSPSAASIKVNIATLDRLITTLRELPESVDELASSFYDLDSVQVDQVTTKCLEKARYAAGLVKLNWDGKEDEFTTWTDKWLDVMR